MSEPTAVGVVIVLDSTDPRSLAEFWAQALRYRRADGVEQYEVLVPPEGGSGPAMLIQGVPEPKQGKNRMHLDLHVPDVAAEVERLVALGATRHGDGALGDIAWVRMSDPEGNEFDLCRD
jgi:predicted enzyme related to lactoylglutathione lyase